MDPFYDDRDNSTEYEKADESTPDHRSCECGAKLERITGAGGREFHGYNCPNDRCNLH